eukprot:1140951-Pelagomonas_calceolata.AAC.1
MGMGVCLNVERVHLLGGPSIGVMLSLQLERVPPQCTVENKNTPHSQVLEPGVSSSPPDPH